MILTFPAGRAGSGHTRAAVARALAVAPKIQPLSSYFKLGSPAHQCGWLCSCISICLAMYAIYFQHHPNVTRKTSTKLSCLDHHIRPAPAEKGHLICVNSTPSPRECSECKRHRLETTTGRQSNISKTPLGMTPCAEMGSSDSSYLLLFLHWPQ